MSKKYLLVVILIGLAVALAFSVIGQEEPTTQPLPIVQAKVSTFGLIDPSLEFQWPTLAEAARRHDYVSFNAVYLESKARGESVAEYDALYDLWTWSMNDPIGAFYGRDLHDRIAGAYPGFADYIAELAIVDSRGNTFYPTSETRAFLLEKAIAGTPSPRLTIVETRVASVATSVVAAPREERTATRSSAAPSPRRARRAEARVAAPTSAPAKTAAPVVETPAPAPVQAATAPAPTPVVTEPPVVVKAEEPAPAPAAQTKPAAAEPVVPEASGLRSRGILLLVIGLIGIGLLALILRTPKEAVPSTILAPPATDKPPAPVEPIRRAAAPDSPKGAEKPRATGSHG